MRRRLAGITIGLIALALPLAGCMDRDNIVDPEFEGTVTIEGPSRITQGGTVSFTVRIDPEPENPPQFLWSSSNPLVLRVLMNGRATVLSEGTTRVRAIYFGPGAEQRDLVIEKEVVVDL